MKILFALVFAVSIVHADTKIIYEGTYKKNPPPNSKCGLEITFDENNQAVEVHAYIYQKDQFAHSAYYNNRDEENYNDGVVKVKTKDGKIQKLKGTATNTIFSGLPYSTLSVSRFDTKEMKADIRVATTNEIGFSWMSKKTCEKMRNAGGD